VIRIAQVQRMRGEQSDGVGSPERSPSSCDRVIADFDGRFLKRSIKPYGSRERPAIMHTGIGADSESLHGQDVPRMPRGFDSCGVRQGENPKNLTPRKSDGERQKIKPDVRERPDGGPERRAYIVARARRRKEAEG
jgi:hypothetical protein